LYCTNGNGPNCKKNDVNKSDRLGECKCLNREIDENLTKDYLGTSRAKKTQTKTNCRKKERQGGSWLALGNEEKRYGNPFNVEKKGRGKGMKGG